MMTLSCPVLQTHPAKTRPADACEWNLRLPAFLALIALLSACTQGPVAPTARPEPPAGKAVDATAATTDVATADDALQAIVELMSAGRFQDAIEPLQRQIENHPERAELYTNLGIAYARTHQLEDAEAAFKAALERGFTHAELHNQLGVVYREMGRFKEAEQAYITALKLDPKHANTELNLGILLELYLQDPKRALPHFQAYESLRNQDKEVAKWIKDIERRREDGEL